MVEHREGRFCPEDCVNPGDAKCARSNHRAERRIQRMPAVAQNARRYFIQIAQRLKEQDAQDAHGGVLDHGGLRCEQAGESIAEQDDRKNRDRAAKRRQPKAEPENPLASAKLSCGAAKGLSRH